MKPTIIFVGVYKLIPTYNCPPIPVMQRRVPEGLSGIARRVAAGMPQFAGGIHPLPANPDKSEERSKQAAEGSLSFGFFLLAAQKKETRPWVREPTLKNRRVSDTYYITSSWFDKLTTNGFYFPIYPSTSPSTSLSTNGFFIF
ncbi:hypothetical protein MCAMS1_01074 [biofilm metagenome]